MAETQKSWFAAKVWLRPPAVEAVEFALLEAGASGTEIDLLGKKSDADVCVVGYFEAEPDKEELKSQISDGLSIYNVSPDSILNLEISRVENRDWLEEWKRHWQPTETEKFVVAPPWSEINNDKIAIRIEPGMAFGTGTHETTRLCLMAIERRFAGNSFLDVGTGTGVLAIAAAKLFPGAMIEACDVDFDSVMIAIENAETNDVYTINFRVGSLEPATATADFVVANLTADVIVPLLPLLVEKTKNTLVLSGILREQENLIVDELNELGVEKFEVEGLGEWLSFTIVK